MKHSVRTMGARCTAESRRGSIRSGNAQTATCRVSLMLMENARLIKFEQFWSCVRPPPPSSQFDVSSSRKGNREEEKL